MIYQIRINMLCPNEGIARGLFNHCRGVLLNATVINPGLPNMEFSSIELIENHHDLNPTLPCQILDEANNKP